MTEGATHERTASEQIDSKIAGLGDWRASTLARMRRLILEADPGIVEAVKWRKPSNPAGVPVWECSGILCTGDLQGQGEADLRPRRVARRSVRPVQLQPRRRNPAGDRPA